MVAAKGWRKGEGLFSVYRVTIGSALGTDGSDSCTSRDSDAPLCYPVTWPHSSCSSIRLFDSPAFTL